jgi:hypothetical protein
VLQPLILVLLPLLSCACRQEHVCAAPVSPQQQVVGAGEPGHCRQGGQEGHTPAVCGSSTRSTQGRAQRCGGQVGVDA